MYTVASEFSRRLGRAKGWSGRVRKISPPTGIRTPDRPVATPTELSRPDFKNGIPYLNMICLLTPSAGRRRWRRMSGRGFGTKWSGLIDVIAWHMPEVSEGNHANIPVRTECAPTQFQTECLLIKCRAMSFRYLCAHLTQLNYQKYRVSIKSFPDYKHLLQENYVEYKHIFLPLINPLNAKLNPICHLLALLGAHHIFHVSGLRVKVVSKILYHVFIVRLQLHNYKFEGKNNRRFYYSS